MHCQICNSFLTEFESSRIDIRTGEHLDTCNECWSYYKSPTIDNFDLAVESDMVELDEYKDYDK